MARAGSNTPWVAAGQSTNGATIPGKTATGVYLRSRVTTDGIGRSPIRPKNENRMRKVPIPMITAEQSAAGLVEMIDMWDIKMTGDFYEIGNKKVPW